jgi:hypothetical protein
MKTRNKQFVAVHCALLLSAVSAVAQNDGSKSQIVERVIHSNKLRHCLFARTLLHYALEKCLAASEQAVVRVRERKHRQEGKGRLALGAAATTNLDPVVILVMRLLATAPVAVDRIAVTNRTMAYDSRVAVFGPVGGKFRQRDGDWDELNRNSQGFRPGVDPPRSRPSRSPSS